MGFRDDLQLTLTAGARGVWITTFEEPRVRDDLRHVAQKMSTPLFFWSAATGLILEGSDEPAIVPPGAKLAGTLQYLTESQQVGWLVLFDADTELQDRRVRELELYGNMVCIVVSTKAEIPFALSHEFVPLPYRLPTAEEIGESVKRMRDVSSTGVFPVSEAAVGLTLHEARFAIRRAVLAGHKRTPDLVANVWAYKTEQIAQSGMLTISRPEETWDDVAGVYKFREWIESRIKVFGQEARKNKVPSPRGVLFVGPFGTGKSLISKVIASKLGWQYVEWKLDKLMDPYVGNTEANTRRMIELTELHTPCVVRIDEITNQVSGHESSGYTDSGVVSRMVGSLLTWMEERTANVFLAASTNEPWRLPGHMARSGRFDAIFYVGLPKADALEEILRLKLKKYVPTLDWTDVDIPTMARTMHTEKFSPAEAEQVVIDSVQTSYPQVPTNKHLQRAIQTIVPVSVTMAEQTKRIEEWARTRAQSADL